MSRKSISVICGVIAGFGSIILSQRIVDYFFAGSSSTIIMLSYVCLIIFAILTEIFIKRDLIVSGDIILAIMLAPLVIGTNFYNYIMQFYVKTINVFDFTDDLKLRNKLDQLTGLSHEFSIQTKKAEYDWMIIVSHEPSKVRKTYLHVWNLSDWIEEFQKDIEKGPFKT